MIIALVVTAGKRNLDKTLRSIESQISKVDKIFIASEIPLNCKYDILVNPYDEGISRNTMQALARIKNFYKNQKVFVATIDDDDYWEKNFIFNAKLLIKKGFNFISGHLAYTKNDVVIQIEKFNNNLSFEDFLYGNPGIEGSNKIFDLEIALESGGMPKHIKTATDRAFNINLLLHPEINLGIINEVVAYHTIDSSNRVTNSKNKKSELQTFYKHFWHLIDKSKIQEINSRHKKLHNLERVIDWK